MMRNLLIVFFVLVLVGGGIAGYLFYTQLKSPASKAINAIPTNAALIIESRDFQKTWQTLEKTTTFWRTLSGVNFIKQLNLQTAFLDSLLSAESKASLLVKGRPAFISAHLTGSNDYSFLFLIGLETISQISTINDVLSKASRDMNVQERSYDKVTISQIAIAEKTSFSYSFSKGIFIGSFSPVLVEDAIRQLNSGSSLIDEAFNPTFARVHATAGENVDANIYVNYEMFPKLLSTFLNSKSSKSVEPIEGLANWSALDLKIKPTFLMLNGLTLPKDSSDKFFSVLFGQTPQEVELTDIMPDNTGKFTYFGINAFESYYTAFKFFLDGNKTLYDYQRRIDKLNTNYGLDLQSDLLSLVGSEFASLATGNINSPNPSLDATTEYLIIKLKDEVASAHAFRELVRKVGEFNELPNTDSLEQYRDHTIGALGLDNVWGILLGPTFGTVKENFYTIIDEYLIFANTTEDIKSFIGSNLAERTLERDVHYQSFAANISSKTNCYTYFNIPICLKTKMLQRSVTGNLTAEIRNNLEALQEFEALGIQYSMSELPEYLGNENNMLFTNVFLSYNPGYTERAQLFKQARLDAPLSRKPWIVMNHYTRNSEVFIQDDNNQVYLIDKSGNILWKKQLDAPIIGDVQQVDIYKSNKLQLLFNTRTHLHMLDRKGRNVERYPISLKATATNGLMAFDYDNNKKYRILIACEDGKVYNYDIYGKPVTGWQFDKTNAPVYAPFSHLSFKGMDYIFFIDVNGEVYTVDRKGNERIKITQRFKHIYNNKYFIEKGKSIESTFILASDSSGAIFKISFGNKKDSVIFDDYEHPPFFEYEDVDMDGRPDYVLLDKSEVLVYNADKNLIINRSFDNNIIYTPDVYYLSGNVAKVGIVADRSEEMFLFNKDGSLSQGFPLYGNTPFSLIEEGGTVNLVAGAPGRTLYIYTLE
ncbi:MAG: hypothetical protein JKX74_04415 [Flavobacteriales bacterium]|nr:hypothetical protein [Flavobacteriales bacterium]